MEPEKTCVVSGALGLVLQLSRPVGLAPLRFVKHRHGWLISVSPTNTLYAYLIVTTLNLGNLTGLILDLSDNPEKSVRVSTPLKRAVWIVDLTIVTMVASVAGYSSPQIMNQMIICLKQLDKINITLKKYKTRQTSEKFNIGLTAFALLCCILLIATDYAAVLIGASKTQASISVQVLYWSYYCQYTMLQLIQMQFVFITLRLHTSLIAINNGLKCLLHYGNIDYSKRVCLKKPYSKKVLPVKMINSITDTIGMGVIPTDTLASTSKLTTEIIQHLSHSYSIICDLVKQVDRSFGLTILLLFCSFLFHMVASLYYFITTLMSKSSHTSAELFNRVTLQLVWSAYHLFNCIVVVEPVHRTSEEMEGTKELVMQLMRTNSGQWCQSQLMVELDLFYRQLLLDRTLYAPLRVFTINRSIIATLLGSVTTYLVIVTQI